MEILNAQQFNEKLNIQPVTKERLGKYVKQEIETYENGLLGKIVKIGNLYWTAENLCIQPNSKYKERRDYFMEHTDKDLRMFYKFDTALNVIPNGWHLPTVEEITSLLDTYGRDSDLWISMENGGADKYGLSGLLWGCYYCGFPYEDGDTFSFWLGSKSFGSGEYERAHAFNCGRSNYNRNAQVTAPTTSVHALTVRLVKDY